MTRRPTALVFDAADVTISRDAHGGIEDVTPGRWVTVEASGPVYDSLRAGEPALPDLPADLADLFA